MKAIVQNSYGSADVLQLRDIAAPVPGRGEVLVRVRAAGADPGVWHMMTGVPYMMRVIGFGFRRPKVPVRGMALAGVVEAAGPEAGTFRSGDEVCGVCRSGSFAEYAVARDGLLVPKPAGLSFEQAAALPVSAVTALQAVRDQAKVRAGQHVMVIGAGGGIGTYVVQLAKAEGATTPSGRPAVTPSGRPAVTPSDHSSPGSERRVPFRSRWAAFRCCPPARPGPGTLVSVRQMTGGILQAWPPATPFPRISRAPSAGC
jgi:NADPH:quinone reductase-like Zn-dependent oxidoreductase